MTGSTADPGHVRLTASDLLVVTALRIEQAALAGRIPGARVERCGMGAGRVQRWLPRLADRPPGALAVAGVAGGLDPTVRPGDVVVANAVAGPSATVALPASTPLVAELRRLGLRVHHGRMSTVDHVVRGAERAQLAGTGAVAVDMESAVIVEAVSRLPGPAVPVAVVRVVVDAADAPLARLGTLARGPRALWTLRRLAPALRWWADQSPTAQPNLTGPDVRAGEDRSQKLQREVVA